MVCVLWWQLENDSGGYHSEENQQPNVPGVFRCGNLEHQLHIDTRSILKLYSADACLKIQAEIDEEEEEFPSAIV